MPKIIESLVEDDLHYCCPFAFFSLYKETRMLEARLGVSDRQIRVWKQKLREGKITCKGKPDCLRCRMKDVKMVLSIRREEEEAKPPLQLPSNTRNS